MKILSLFKLNLFLALSLLMLNAVAFADTIYATKYECVRDIEDVYVTYKYDVNTNILNVQRDRDDVTRVLYNKAPRLDVIDNVGTLVSFVRPPDLDEFKTRTITESLLLPVVVLKNKGSNIKFEDVVLIETQFRARAGADEYAPGPLSESNAEFVSCTASFSDEVPMDDNSVKISRDFIGLGKGSGTFLHLLTFYKYQSDSDSKNSSGKRLRVVLDSNAKNPSDGSTVVSRARIKLSEACAGTKDIELDNFESRDYLDDSNDKATKRLETDFVLVPVPNCDQNKRVVVEALRQRCLNPTNADCQEYVVEFEYSVPISAFSELTPQSELPGLVE